MKILLATCLCLLCSCVWGADVFRLRAERNDTAITTKGDIVTGVITGHGTCFAIAPRVVLTAAHNVIDGDKHIEAIWIEYGGDWIRARVVKANADADIAVLSVEQDLPHYDLGDDPHEDAGVVLYGSARGAKVTQETGIVKTPYWNGSIRFLVSVTKFDHGVSGGPVMQGDKVVGMMVDGVPKDGDVDPKKALIVPASALKYFADNK